MKKTWDELVAEGESLKVMEERVESEAGNVRWLWGDLALEVAPMGPDNARNHTEERVRRFAAEVDVAYETLRQYRRVASGWPLGMRVPSQPWVVHQQIIGREDREELIANPVDVRTGEKVDKWTFRMMQRFLGQKESPSYLAPPSTEEEKVEAVMALIEDPEIRALVQDAIDAPISERLTDSTGPIEKSFDDRCVSWVMRLNSLMMEGSKLATEAEDGGHASDAATSHLAVLLYQRLSERQFDTEIRRLLDSEGV